MAAKCGRNVDPGVCGRYPIMIAALRWVCWLGTSSLLNCVPFGRSDTGADEVMGTSPDV